MADGRTRAGGPGLARRASGRQFGHAAFYVDLLQQAIRITYWIAHGRRIILLTVFTKTKDRDRAQVARAKKAMLACIEAKHIVDEDEEQ